MDTAADRHARGASSHHNGMVRMESPFFGGDELTALGAPSSFSTPLGGGAGSSACTTGGGAALGGGWCLFGGLDAGLLRAGAALVFGALEGS